MNKNILITGALGQIGTELTFLLRKQYGENRVIATDVRMPVNEKMRDGGPFEFLDVQNPHQITRIMHMHQIGTIYHLAALLSATGESRPSQAWELNVGGLYNMLESARQYKCSLFFPSSIGVFGEGTPKVGTPQVTIMRPKTMYGITKVTGEMLCDYYFSKFGVDTRGLRFPGLISHIAEPGGGTTDYAVEIFYEAIKHQRYTCYLSENTSLDMMYIDDALEAMVRLMEADGQKLKHRNAYNVTGFQLTPKILAQGIQAHLPNFKISYQVDPLRQAIADSWPDAMDDSAARQEWGWAPKYGQTQTIQRMFEKICQKLSPTFLI